ncbi:MAG: cupin domain-containing protein [Armatimonadota bacterium]
MAKSRSYTALDGSRITELVHPRHDPEAQQLSLAEAVVDPGRSTYRHTHRETGEIYYTLNGHGQLHLGGRLVEMRPGDAHLIPPGTEHWVTALPGAPLRFLCACSPPYSDDDTELTGPVEV